MSNVKQELFDTALNHLRQQGKPSYDGDPVACAYRSEDGLMCAAAPFILEYDEGMEHLAWTDLCMGEFEDKIDPRAVEHEDLVLKFQAIHDEGAEDARELDDEGEVADTVDNELFMRYVERRFEELADDEGLTYKAA